MPLAKSLEVLLDVFKQAMGSLVEIEFSLDMDKDHNGNPTLYLLQIKPLIRREDEVAIDEHDIHPGRWGTRDKFVGIPVLWSQISKAKIIVEQGMKDFPLDASLGSHFFHNVTSMNVGYFAIPFETADSAVHRDKIKAQKEIYSGKYVKHVRFDKPVKVYMDGKKQIAVIAL